MIDSIVCVIQPRPAPPGGMVLMAILVAALAICGWLCIYKTDALVERQRRRYQKYALVRLYPFSGMVMKSWYPAYLRGSGILLWLWDVVLIYLMWIRKPVR